MNPAGGARVVLTAGEGADAVVSVVVFGFVLGEWGRGNGNE
jgi:hypothetical protein